MRTSLFRVGVPLLLVSSVLSGCVTTSSTGDAPLNQGNWPLCSAIGGLAGGGLCAIESSTWAAGGAVAGAVIGTLISDLLLAALDPRIRLQGGATR